MYVHVILIGTQCSYIILGYGPECIIDSDRWQSTEFV